MILTKNTPEAKDYLKTYQELSKAIIIQISSEDIKNNIQTMLLRDQILTLLENQIPVTIVIDNEQQFESDSHLNPNKKKYNNEYYLTENNLKNEIIPLYEETIRKIKILFSSHEINILTTNDLECNYKSTAGLTGFPEKISLDITSQALNIIGFIGSVNSPLESSSIQVNVKANDTLIALAKQFTNSIAEIMIISPIGGIFNTKNELIKLISKEKLRSIIHGHKQDIKLDTKNLKQVKAINEILSYVSKTVIVSSDNILKELKNHEGGGSLIIDISKNTPVKYSKRSIFEFIYNKCVKQNDWKERSDEEKEEIYKNYLAFIVDGTVIGGYSLLDFEINGIEGKLLECLYVAEEKIGIPEEIFKHLLLFDKPIYAYSNKNVFERNHFEKVDGIQPETGSKLMVLKKN